MTDHRTPTNPGVEGNNLAKATDDLTAQGQPTHSWLDDARKTAYYTVDCAKDAADRAPVGTAIVGLAVGVAAYGALRGGLVSKALALVTEGKALPAAEVLAANNAAMVGGTEALANGADALAGKGGHIVHLTTTEGKIGIANSLKIGSRWGVYGLENSQVPQNAFVRKIASLVPKELTSEVGIGPRASSYFEAPRPLGPFSLARNLAGVKNTPLGSIDLARDAFIPNEIFSNGTFRQATGKEIAKYKVHQWLLDYGVDTLLYTWAGISTAALEYRQLCEKADKKLASQQEANDPHK